MLIYGLIFLIGSILLVIVESFLVALGGFHLSFLVLLFFYGKVRWKLLLVVLVLLSFALDVVFHYPSGTSLLISVVPILLVLISSNIFALDTGFFAYLLRFFAILIYYILLQLLPPFFESGVFGSLTANLLLASALKSVVGVLLLMVLERLLSSFRGKDSSSYLKLK